MDDNATFQFSLHQNDLVKLVTKKKTILGYFNGLNRSTGNIDIKEHDLDKSKIKDGIHQSVGIKLATSFEKYQVDELGKNIHLCMRSAVARSLVLYGWLPQLGLFHHSELNAFNLADDFIEPFRPLVDLLVWNLLEKGLITTNLSPISKQQLIKILHHQLCFNQEKVSVLTAIDKSVASLQIALIQKNAALLQLPEIDTLQEYQYE